MGRGCRQCCGDQYSDDQRCDRLRYPICVFHGLVPLCSLLPARGELRGRLFPWGHRAREGGWQVISQGAWDHLLEACALGHGSVTALVSRNPLDN